MTEYMKIKIKKLHPDAKIPVFSLRGDAGMDLFSFEDYILEPQERHIFQTGIALKIPKNYVCLAWDKGGLSHKHGIKSFGGVFDSNYTGEYLVCLANFGKEDFAVKKGQKIVQLLFQKVETPKIEIVKELPKTNRGEGRHGSTGL